MSAVSERDPNDEASAMLPYPALGMRSSGKPNFPDPAESPAAAPSQRRSVPDGPSHQIASAAGTALVDWFLSIPGETISRDLELLPDSRLARVRRMSYICLFKMGRQRELRFPKHGGRRRDAGRKPTGDRPGVPHRCRAPLASRFPAEVTLRVEKGVANLRRARPYAAVREAIRAANEVGRLRVTHYSVMGNHLHLIVEAKDADALSRGMQGLSIRLARGLNRVLGRRGRVFCDRFHSRVLKTPREVRSALAYVLGNARKHRLVRGVSRLWVDPFSSGCLFDGWKTRVQRDAAPSPPVAAAGTWLLSRGWRRHGLLDPAFVPGIRAPAQSAPSPAR